MNTRKSSRSNAFNGIGPEHEGSERQGQIDQEDGSLKDSSAFFTEFVDRYGPGILSVAMSILGSRDEAEDVVQEGFLRAFAAVR